MGKPRPIYRCRVCGAFTEEPLHCGRPAELLMSGEQRLRLSKLMSALLRHIPGEAGLQLDPQGWVEVRELARAIRERWRARHLYTWVTPDHIVAVARLDPKGRFQLSSDGSRIRAAYGHSVEVELGYRPLGLGEAPPRLYHGTPARNLASIMKRGLLPMKRMMVHLSADPATAEEVGRRHGGDVVVLEVDTGCLAERRLPLYRASEKVYLAPRVPPECIRLPTARERRGGLSVAGAKIDLSGLGVLVTASTRGIGFYVASGLASMGARVVITGRSRERLDQAVAEIRSSGGEVYGVQGDLSTREGVERVHVEAWRILGSLDAVVFNIGNVSCEPCFLHEAGYEDWAEAARLHLVAPGYLSSLYVSRLLSTKQRGTLVFLSSISVREPMPQFVLADTARAGLVQLARSIALRYAPHGVRAYTVLMGSFDTPGARRNIEAMARRHGISFEEAWRRWVLELTPLRRVGKPEELASLVGFLLTEEAEYMNGATIPIDGAMSRCAV